MGFELDAALTTAFEAGASDLHVKVPSVPRIRIEGALQPLPGAEPLTVEDAERVAKQVIRTDVKRRDFDERGSADLSYQVGDGRFRVAAFLQRGVPSFVFRTIPEAPSAQGLRLPQAVLNWAEHRQGLVIVTGPTGSGKSTTTAALLRIINETYACHVVTIEDPIEFVHQDGEALISQREVGADASSYHDALRATLRQDPDVIVIGEIRDEETAMTALRASETGHLVFATLHTSDATETVQRLMDLFKERHVDLARKILASTLVGITSQRLVPGRDGKRVLAAEVLVNTARVHNLLLDNKIDEIRQAVEEGEYYGMQTFDQALLGHVRDGLIDQDEAVSYATDPHDFKLMLAGTKRQARMAAAMASSGGVR